MCKKTLPCATNLNQGCVIQAITFPAALKITCGLQKLRAFEILVQDVDVKCLSGILCAPPVKYTYNGWPRLAPTP